VDILGKEAASVDVGQRLRELRKERGVSMRALARRSHLSANALSMIERSLTSPSVSTLIKLANALEVPIMAFFRKELQKSNIVFCKAGDRTRLTFNGGVWEGLGGEHFSGRMEAFRLTLEINGSSGVHDMLHSGHEFVYCLGGQLEYEVEGLFYELEAGDSLTFAAHMKHRWRNMGSDVVNAIILISSFDESEQPGQFHLASSSSAQPIELIPDSSGEEFSQ
jgi:quercetin dioxygenase-like cupin family protein/DNA-binding XRE family transcriptional regulator